MMNKISRAILHETFLAVVWIVCLLVVMALFVEPLYAGESCYPIGTDEYVCYDSDDATSRSLRKEGHGYYRSYDSDTGEYDRDYYRDGDHLYNPETGEYIYDVYEQEEEVDESEDY